ncbi:hypothetical protein [Paenibacillus sp. GXUN7292]
MNHEVTNARLFKEEGIKKEAARIDQIESDSLFPLEKTIVQ